jgi:hypothetical protein
MTHMDYSLHMGHQHKLMHIECLPTLQYLPGATTMKKLISVFVLGLALVPLVAQAVQVSFASVSLGSDHYRYEYTIHNDGSLGTSTSLALLDLLFDPALYQESSLTNVSAATLATNWSQQFLASAPDVPAAFDLMAKGVGIPVGGQVSGFAVEFHWLGAGGPGNQPFEVYDAVTFDKLEQGMTSAVPEPETWLMLLAGTPLLVALSRRRLSSGNSGSPIQLGTRS